MKRRLLVEGIADIEKTQNRLAQEIQCPLCDGIARVHPVFGYPLDKGLPCPVCRGTGRVSFNAFVVAAKMQICISKLVASRVKKVSFRDSPLASLINECLTEQNGGQEINLQSLLHYALCSKPDDDSIDFKAV